MSKINKEITSKEIWPIFLRKKGWEVGITLVVLAYLFIAMPALGRFVYHDVFGWNGDCGTHQDYNAWGSMADYWNSSDPTCHGYWVGFGLGLIDSILIFIVLSALSFWIYCNWRSARWEAEYRRGK